MSVVRAFYAALDAESIDAIMELIADEPEIETLSGVRITERRKIRLDLEFILSKTDNTFEVDAFQVEGNRVAYDYWIRDGQQRVVEQGRSEVVVERGKIRLATGISFGTP